MRFLDRTLAQEIVNRTMSIINRNINVMDESGTIIGSGDKDRIDSIHEGALRVIETQSGFEISESEARKLHGVKAGINLPIYFHDEVVGVIGITGIPEEINNYGELVKMAAEMIVQQAVLLDEIQWDVRLKEELIMQLLQGPKHAHSLYFERLKRHGIDIDIPRVAVMIATDDLSKTYKWIREKRGKDDLYVMHSDYIILLKKVVVKEGIWDDSKTLEQLKNWAGKFEKEQADCKIAIGSYHSALEGISESYREALYTLAAGEKLDPHKSMYVYDDYKLPIFLAQADQHGIGEQIGPYYQQMIDHDKKGELLQTLLAFIEENGDMNNAARKLYIHRNTLRYRLEKILELTGKDPRQLKDLLILYLSVLQNKLK